MDSQLDAGAARAKLFRKVDQKVAASDGPICQHAPEQAHNHVFILDRGHKKISLAPRLRP
jgi:hypothetical protein